MPRAPKNQPPADPGAPPTKKKRRKWPWILAGVLLVLFIIGSIAGQDDDTQEASDDTAQSEPSSSTTPSEEPSEEPTPEETEEPSEEPSEAPSEEPSEEPTPEPTEDETEEPAEEESEEPSPEPSEMPSESSEPADPFTALVEASKVDNAEAHMEGTTLFVELDDMSPFQSLAQKDTVDILETASQSDLTYDTVVVVGYEEGQDSYGNEARRMALNAGYSYDTVQRINYDNVVVSDIWTLRDQGGGWIG